MVEYHRRKNTWLEKVDRFIALTEFAKSRFIKAGFPASKISIKPNFVKQSASSNASFRQGALFVGRLSQEKGIHVLLNAWSQLDFPLRIAGEGPLVGLVKEKASFKIVALGRLSADLIRAEMSAAEFLIMPSIWNETFGLVIIEAFANGLPVIVSNMGSMSELVKDGITGLHFEAKNADDLAKKVRWAFTNPSMMRQMGKNAFKVYQERYTPGCNYKILSSIYDSLLHNFNVTK
jgi:glycosyltransferase involved in cell wall biosynthesis